MTQIVVPQKLTGWSVVTSHESELMAQNVFKAVQGLDSHWSCGLSRWRMGIILLSLTVGSYFSVLQRAIELWLQKRFSCARGWTQGLTHAS